MYIYPSSPESASSLQSEESAAIKIQAGFRGYRVRKQLHRTGSQQQQQQQQHQQYQHQQQQQQQQLSNGFLPHRHHRTQRNNQAQSRMERTTSTSVPTENGASPAENTIEERSATKIQAGVRGFLVRKKQKIATDAATKIQAGFRGFKARKETQKMKQK